MRSYLKKIRRNYKFGSAILLFIFAFLLLAYMMPRERKFTFHFQVNQPWREENLTAPFDFSILKTEKQLEAERDSILSDLRAFYTFNAEVADEFLNRFREQFHNEWVAFAIQKFQAANENEYLGSRKFGLLREMEDYYKGIIASNLESIYNRGIVELPEGNIRMRDMSEIVLIRGNVADEIRFSTLYTLRSAYEDIRGVLSDSKAYGNTRYASEIDNFLEDFEIERYITPNVFFDQTATERERNTRLSAISIKKGLIQRGEIIVEKGEIVTPEKYLVLTSLKTAYNEKQRNVNSLLVLAGKLIFVFFVLLLIYIFLYNFRRELLRDVKKTAFILFLILLMVFTASAISRFESDIFYIIPFAILPILLRTFFDERVAVFIHVLTSLIIGIIAPNSYEFIVLNIISGIVAIFTLTNLYHRSRFFLAALFVTITYSITYLGMQLVNVGNLSQISISNFIYFGVNGVLILISFLLIYIFEKLFGFLSDTTLMELSDTNNPLLRKLAEVAPGTFHHCLQVASLSEDAIHRIGGNPLLVRTGALYHDIGKMVDPIYFIENQTSGINPHYNLPFEKSADIIISHVKHGLDMASKNNLPKSIIDFIRTHHGTTTVQYFYRSYIKKYPLKEVDLAKFSYPGPKPFSKEMAVLMMADSVEAASRSLTEITHDSISALVDNIIDKQMEAKQFEIAPITFRDISSVKQIFKTKLLNIYHARISYPSEVSVS
mgnify:CR=1 FL=1